MGMITKTNSITKPVTSYFFLCFAQLMVSLNVIGSKLIVGKISFLMAVFLRFSFATLIILTIAIFQGNVKKSHFQLPPKHWFILILQGLCAGALFNMCLMTGLQYTTASMAGILISLLPAVIAIAAMIFLKEKLSYCQIIGIGLALIGLLIINNDKGGLQISHQAHEIIGILFLLLALIPETTYYLLSKKYQNKLPILAFAGLLNGINVIFLLPLVVWYEPNALAHINSTAIKILFLSGMASAIFYISWSMGIKHISATKAGLLTALCPLMTAIIAALFLHEKITRMQMIGILIVLTSIILSNKK